VARNRRGSRSKDQGSPAGQGSSAGQGSRPEPRRDGSSQGNNLKVVSGGQTGIDRGALDAALELSIECGGWCPEGRQAEDGVIPEQYPLREVEGGDYRERTRKNVLDSDGTAIIFFGEIEGGTEATLDDCVQLGRPYKLIDGSAIQPGQAAKLIAEFVREIGVYTLNIAGPRASKVEKGHRYAFDTVRMLVDVLKGKIQPPSRKSPAAGGRQRSPGQSQGSVGNGNGNGRGGKSRNPQFNAQKRKGSGQQTRSRHGARPTGTKDSALKETVTKEPGNKETGTKEPGTKEPGTNEPGAD
jgi:hypothetical protein